MTRRPPDTPKPDVLSAIADELNNAADLGLKTAAKLEQIAQATADPELRKSALKTAREAKKTDKMLRAIGARRVRKA